MYDNYFKKEVYTKLDLNLIYTSGEYYNLLPFSYIVSNTLTDPIRSYWFSKNNPKDISLSNISLPIPITYSTTYTYDPQSYPLSGFGTNYDYRPF